MTGYLIYVYHKHLKVDNVWVSKIPSTSIYPITMDILDDNGNRTDKYHSKVPSVEMTLGWGKIWCRDEENIEKCKDIIRRHYRETGRELYETGKAPCYIRTKTDSSQKCPFCQSQYLMTGNRYGRVYVTNIDKISVITCNKCGNSFTVIIDRKTFKRYVDTGARYDKLSYDEWIERINVLKAHDKTDENIKGGCNNDGLTSISSV